MKFIPVTQGSVEWYALKLGRPSASNFHKVITPKGEASKQSKNYAYRLVAERLLRDTMEDQIGTVRWVEHGKVNEANAVAHFALINELHLDPGGLVTTDDGRLVASPDRIVRSKHGVEGVEVKCPAPWTMVEYLLEGPGDDYRPQVQGQLLVSEFRAVHFFAWHPQMPSFHRVTLPDANYLALMRSALATFCDALDVMTERAKAIGAYAVVRRGSTPADLAYGEEEDAQLKIVDPNIGGWVP